MLLKVSIMYPFICTSGPLICQLHLWFQLTSQNVLWSSASPLCSWLTSRIIQILFGFFEKMVLSKLLSACPFSDFSEDFWKEMDFEWNFFSAVFVKTAFYLSRGTFLVNEFFFRKLCSWWSQNWQITGEKFSYWVNDFLFVWFMMTEAIKAKKVKTRQMTKPC